jgi:lipoprotein-releasing system permease protein
LYKLLLCWRYLLTRYLALVCIGSVMLGVATLIVVNSVMSGFSTKLRDRLHALLSDVVVEAEDNGGFEDPEGKMAQVRSDPWLNEHIEAMAPTLEIFAMLQFRCGDQAMIRPVHLIGIEPEGRARVGGFAEYLVDKRNRPYPSFTPSPEAQAHHELRERSRLGMHLGNPYPQQPAPLVHGVKPPPMPPPSRPYSPQGAIVGYAIAHFRKPKAMANSAVKDIRMLEVGDDIVLTTMSGQRMAPVYDRFLVTDYFKSEMSEYDSNYVFVPLHHLQKIRTMEDRVTSIQVRLKKDITPSATREVVQRLQGLFAGLPVRVETWEDKQGPLLAAIRVEKGILNVLLFLIIAVAGFGILAIFSMIVVEKTRDIGILKALGAANVGVLNIFLGYGLLLGLVGAALGTTLGLSLTLNLNEIEKGLSHITGQDIFPRETYYFDRIPTDIQPLMIILVNVGSLAIAVLFSVLPALRAAMLHPVRALRYE